MELKPIEWMGDSLKILDQVELPSNEIYRVLVNYRDIVKAIKTLQVRGAPAIGIAAAYGIALGANSIKATSLYSFRKELEIIVEDFASSRPTAVNLFFAIDSMRCTSRRYDNINALKKALIETAASIHRSEAEAMAKLSRLGASLIPANCRVLTHCNSGQLATGVEYGTALGIVKAAKELGSNIHVIADETRPLLQGARLTTWELQKLGIPVTLISDNMAGYFIHKHAVDCIIVGADRIAANGDTANKIGTYGLSVLAFENEIPFYVAAPLSTFDTSIPDGNAIPIEQRSQEEVIQLLGTRIAPLGINAANPAFDITEAGKITAIITEAGIIHNPCKTNIASLIQERREWIKSG